MSAVAKTNAGLPPGYVAVPVSEDQAQLPLRICVLYKVQADPAVGPLVLLRDTLDAKIFLGCVIDAGGRVLRWLEVWIQDISGMAQTPAGARAELSNRMLDERWVETFHAFQAASPLAAPIEIGWETKAGRPTYIDPKEQWPVHPSAQGTPLALCRDDALLAKAGLPEYSKSLARYLYAPKAQGPFIAVSEDAPIVEGKSVMIFEAVEGVKDLVPLNPSGGLMMVRPYWSLDYEAVLDAISGSRAIGVQHGREMLQLEGANLDGLMAGRAGGTGAAAARKGFERAFLSSHGLWGSLVEVLHLKLRLLADAVRSVRDLTAAQARPLLNLSPDSFRVSLAEPGIGLPTLWTARVDLGHAGDAVGMVLPGSESRCFVPGKSVGPSIYQPVALGHFSRGRGTLSMRQVLVKGDQPGVIEGTFRTQDYMEAGKHDLTWLHLPLAGARVELYAYLEKTSALATGEWRFRTAERTYPAKMLADLKRAEGIPIPGVGFEVLPSLSSPCDMYSLAVLATRTLLVNPGNTLAVAWDEVQSLTSQVAQTYDADTSLPLRVQGVCGGDRRWTQTLGPHRLLHEQIGPEEALQQLPMELWCEALSLLVRMIPGAGKDSLCAELGHGDPDSMHLIFDPVLEALDHLLTRSRSMIITDWRFNREVQSVIREARFGVK